MAEHDNAEVACDRLMTLFEYALAVDEQRRPEADDSIREPLIRYVIALLRMRVRPALRPGWLTADPVHIAFFGGTNSGKSTVVNVCLGRVAAGMHVTARFSQHPVAYRPEALGDRWLDDYPSRFTGYTRYRDTLPPRQADLDLATTGYRPALAVRDPARALDNPITLAATTYAIFWDVPDFSTEAAQAYLGAVLDVVALADVVVLVVTDESYADHRGGVLLRLVSEAGAYLHIVANKLPDSRALQEDITTKIETNWRGATPHLPVEQWHFLPHVPGETPTARLINLLARHEATALREAIGRTAERPAVLKRQVLHQTLDFCQRRLEEVLQVLTAEVEVAATWERIVTRLTDTECVERYRSNYLHDQRYSEFNQTLLQVMALLEVPGIGPVVRRLREMVRLPWRFVMGWLKQGWGYLPASAGNRLPEAEVLMALVESALAAIKAEAQALAHTAPHPAWDELARGLEDHGWSTQVLKEFEEAYNLYRHTIDAEVQRCAAAIYDMIAQRPRLLNVLRGTNLAMDAATLVLVVKSGGLDWSDAVVGPLVAGLRRGLIEAGFEQYLSTQAALLKRKQGEAVAALVTTHLVRPVCNLLRGTVQREDIDAARGDFAHVQAVVLQRTQEASA
jgi:hypothetical protein